MFHALTRTMINWSFPKTSAKVKNNYYMSCNNKSDYARKKVIYHVAHSPDNFYGYFRNILKRVSRNTQDGIIYNGEKS